ncbi:MAG: hypothetical protein JST93_30835 [Acidobacteria bacterium]|nr:hypothetical protein [Acidobacteriota bacterium]
MNRHASRRTTLTLPASSLDLAEGIARKRHVNLSTVVGEALQRGLREEVQALRKETILQSYRKAFTGFSPEELLLLDGIVAEPHPTKRTPKTRTRK